MPGIPKEMIEHKLGIDPSYKPIRQKERRYTPERRGTIRQEVNKLLEVRFIRLVDYPSWLANPILVEKLDGSWRMCINYTSLNKSCPKDEYLLTHICQIIDSKCRVNYCHFWMPIQGSIKLASPLTMKKKQRSSHHLGSSVTQRWHSG
jgi:hypothetical protein